VCPLKGWVEQLAFVNIENYLQLVGVITGVRKTFIPPTSWPVILRQ
jgi:hypothetical protein